MVVEPAPQTAMMLTQQEWDDLAAVCQFYRTNFDPALVLAHPDVKARVVADHNRRYDLTGRIIEASE